MRILVREDPTSCFVVLLTHVHLQACPKEERVTFAPSKIGSSANQQDQLGMRHIRVRCHQLPNDDPIRLRSIAFGEWKPVRKTINSMHLRIASW
jgi:hypothetical protein